MKPHAMTYTAADARNPQAMHNSRTQGGYRKHHLDRVGRPPRWVDCDADEFLRDLDRGRISEPDPEPEPQTEGEQLLAALRRIDLSITQAANRVGMFRQTLTCQLTGRRELRRDVADALWQLIRGMEGKC